MSLDTDAVVIAEPVKLFVSPWEVLHDPHGPGGGEGTASNRVAVSHGIGGLNPPLAAPVLEIPPVGPCAEVRDIMEFIWWIIGDLGPRLPHVLPAISQEDLIERVEALGPWPDHGGANRRCQRTAAHPNLAPHFFCERCEEFVDRVMREFCPELWDENLWMPHCARCSHELTVEAGLRDRTTRCTCPLGRPHLTWVLDGKLLCMQCRVEYLYLRREANWQAWETRSEGRRINVERDGQFIETLEKIQCECGNILDDGEPVQTCPQCGGMEMDSVPEYTPTQDDRLAFFSTDWLSSARGPLRTPVAARQEAKGH